MHKAVIFRKNKHRDRQENSLARVELQELWRGCSPAAFECSLVKKIEWYREYVEV